MNTLNVLKYGYMRGWRNFFRNIKNFFCSLKYAYQRITKSYCDWDLWSLDIFYSRLFVNSLNELADTCIGYPVDYETPEAWQARLHEISNHFYNSLEENEVQKNEYDKYINWNILDGKIQKTGYEEKWLTRNKEIYQFMKKERELGLQGLFEEFDHLWD